MRSASLHRRSDAELARERKAEAPGAEPTSKVGRPACNGTSGRFERTLWIGTSTRSWRSKKPRSATPGPARCTSGSSRTPTCRFYTSSGRRGEGVVAFCSFWLVLDEIHINNLAVRDDFRGRGVGTSLLEHVIQAGASRGAERATLEVRRSNAPARPAVRASRLRSGGDPAELLRQPVRRCAYPMERSHKIHAMSP